MEAVIFIFIGIQATGKSSFYLVRFFDTHVRISLDMLKTRRREGLLFQACLEMKQPFAIDNTNPTKKERARYIPAAKEAGFNVVGYYFEAKFSEVLKRNEGRSGKKRIPIKGIGGTLKRLEPPSLGEGFDALYHVSIKDGEFVVEPWLEEA